MHRPPLKPMPGYVPDNTVRNMQAYLAKRAKICQITKSALNATQEYAK